VILAAPLIIAAHLATLPTLDGWSADDPTGRPAVQVFDGPRLDRGDMRRWCTVGFVPGADGPAVHLEPETNGQRQNLEVGSVDCSLVVAAADVPTARTAVFDLLAAWSQWLSTDRTLTGRLLAGSTTTLGGVDVALATTRAGGTASAVVTVTYQARTYG